MPYQADSELRDFVQSLPKTETHLHIEGALPVEMLRRLDPSKLSPPPPFWADDYRYDTFYSFMDLYREYAKNVFTSAESYHEAASIILGNCQNQNVHYVETSFHAGILELIKEDGPTVVRAIKEGAPRGLQVRVFMGIGHDAYHGAVKEAIDDCHNWEDLTGVDLHGPEDLPVEDWTPETWARTRATGKFNKAHAGEFMGADFVNKMLDDLQVTRIEHGVRSVENPDVVARLVRENITLDVCPISNVKLAVEGIPSMSAHPIRRLFDKGVSVTLNSDDPFFFGNTLSEEYYALYQDLNFSKVELVQIARNGFNIALWNGREKEACLAQLNAIESSLQ